VRSAGGGKAGGERLRRRRVAELAGGTPNQGSEARFDAREASTRRAQNSGSILGGGLGGDATARAVDAAARKGNSGELTRTARCTGTTTSDAGGCLTSLRISLAASRRRKSGDGDGTRKRRWLGIRWLWWRLRMGKAARVRGVPGAALLIKARAVSLSCGPREGVVLQPDSGSGGGGVRGGDDRAKGMTSGSPWSAAAARAGRDCWASWATKRRTQAGLRRPAAAWVGLQRGLDGEMGRSLEIGFRFGNLGV
jgi:hypothetical protein